MKKDFDELLKEACEVYIKENFSNEALKNKNSMKTTKNKLRKNENKRKNDKK